MQLLPSPSSHPLHSEQSDRNPSIERVVILIDAASLFYAASHLGIEIDYTKLLQTLTHGRPLIRAYFYTGIDPANKKQQNFLFWMRHHGYRVVAKELIQHLDGTKKANLQIEMAIDMLKLASHCETLIVLSGNGELAYAVRKATDFGVQIEVVSLPSMLNDELRDVADRFIDLTKLQTMIQKSVPQAG
ncbi:MAG: NYN domain-containing protein [Leptolyngbya sp. Prado105]|jgi:uncharacterized LabA/DUF88 family protein|nr:NYN domain-containing protein [Leptolyngbya sp. Prado105]